MENLNFDLKEGKIVFANLTLQTMKESKKYVVTSLLDIESINSKKRKFEVSINSNTINYEKFKIFLKKVILEIVSCFSKFFTITIRLRLKVINCLNLILMKYQI